MRTNLHHLPSRPRIKVGAPALTYKDLTVSYADLLDLTNSFAAGLAALGLTRADRVGIYPESGSRRWPRSSRLSALPL
jgi:long-subunit acyl-CoA synthetase (AMP-forming)